MEVPEKLRIERIIQAVSRTIEEDDVTILKCLLDGPSGRCSVGYISRRIGASYLTIKRRVNKLCDKELVRRSNGNAQRRPQYFELTEMGSALIQGLLRIEHDHSMR
jgi:DNA-binding MarR family transcriptional regulator